MPCFVVVEAAKLVAIIGSIWAIVESLEIILGA